MIGLLSGLGLPLYGWICCASLSTNLFLKNSVVSFIISLGSVTNLPSLLWILMFSYGLRCINFAALNIFDASLVWSMLATCSSSSLLLCSCTFDDILCSILFLSLRSFEIFSSVLQLCILSRSCFCCWERLFIVMSGVLFVCFGFSWRPAVSSAAFFMIFFIVSHFSCGVVLPLMLLVMSSSILLWYWIWTSLLLLIFVTANLGLVFWGFGFESLYHLILMSHTTRRWSEVVIVPQYDRAFWSVDLVF